MVESNVERLISVREAAQRLGISRITAYRWTETGTLPSLKLGGRRLISESILNKLILSALGPEVDG